MIRKITLDKKKFSVNELTADQVTAIDKAVLLSVDKVLKDRQSWIESTFELTIDYPELFLKLLSFSTGKKVSVLKSLPAKDYDTLMIIFLSVNAEFFLQRLKFIESAA